MGLLCFFQRRERIIENDENFVAVGFGIRTEATRTDGWDGFRKRGERVVDSASGSYPLSFGVSATRLTTLRWDPHEGLVHTA